MARRPSADGKLEIKTAADKGLNSCEALHRRLYLTSAKLQAKLSRTASFPGGGQGRGCPGLDARFSAPNGAPRAFPIGPRLRLIIVCAGLAGRYLNPTRPAARYGSQTIMGRRRRPSRSGGFTIWGMECRIPL